MKIEIFGPGCPRCVEIEKRAREAVSKAGVTADVEKIRDIAKIVDAGIMHTPGLKINGKLKSSGRIPNVDEIKKWIEEEI
ncbi:MAG: thioredoxin family protein [Candidatus Omnitrophica bacterium]|nr:thioredoxin family protein [Candidatus Omnitrophota bacterium]